MIQNAYVFGNFEMSTYTYRFTQEPRLFPFWALSRPAGRLMIFSIFNFN
jgi:hypothetical protein